MIELDSRRRELLPELEALRAQQNAANDRIRAAQGDERAAEIDAMREVAASAKQLDGELQDVEQRLQAASRRCRTCPSPARADGPQDEEIARSGEPPQLDFEPRDHLDLAGEQDRHGARRRGSRAPASPT